eukprot:3890910-Pyramimonas_sp.AAC.1
MFYAGSLVFLKQPDARFVAGRVGQFAGTERNTIVPGRLTACSARARGKHDACCIEQEDNSNRTQDNADTHHATTPGQTNAPVHNPAITPAIDRTPPRQRAHP